VPEFWELNEGLTGWYSPPGPTWFSTRFRIHADFSMSRARSGSRAPSTHPANWVLSHSAVWKFAGPSEPETVTVTFYKI